MSDQAFDRAQFEQLLQRRFFVAPSFQIYGGVAGLYDLGPPGCALQAEVLSQWRQHFIIAENMLEIDCVSLTPHVVLQTSGHVERFCDAMVKDAKSGTYYRADHLIEATIPNETAILNKLEDMTLDEMDSVIKNFKIKAPDTGNDLEHPQFFNLMFPTTVGPTTQTKSFLRPETAQGHFVNFKKLLEFNNSRIPFASAQIGKAFRNEISPRAGLLRVREFLMAEVEHYVDPLDKSHPRVGEVEHEILTVWTKDDQESGNGKEFRRISIREALDKKLFNSETMAYFLARIQQFLVKVGIDHKKLVFRQHKSNELSHYACDCWDAEVKTSHGWIEIVGCADRSAYDLTRHQEATGQKLVVQQTLETPVEKEVLKLEINKKQFGPRFRKDAKEVEKLLTAMDQSELAKRQKELDSQGSITLAEKFTVDKDIVGIKTVKVVEHVREFVPNVIEPSFGIGRIIYALLENVYFVRAGAEQRGVLAFPPAVAPIKCLIVPLSGNAEFAPFVRDLSIKMRALGISSRVDDSSSSIGRRYARNDELGTPFGITVDFQTVKDSTVTLRERDTTKQIREPIDKILTIISDLVNSRSTWDKVLETCTPFEQQDV